MVVIESITKRKIKIEGLSELKLVFDCGEIVADVEYSVYYEFDDDGWEKINEVVRANNYNFAVAELKITCEDEEIKEAIESELNFIKQIDFLEGVFEDFVDSEDVFEITDVENEFIEFLRNKIEGLLDSVVHKINVAKKNKSELKTDKE